MPIELICKGCGRKLRVGDEHAGKHARCPECGTVTPVSASAASPGYSTLETTPLKPESPLGSTPADRWILQMEDGRTFGPIPREELDRWVAEGRVTPQSFVRKENDVRGVPARDVYPALAARTVAPNPFADQPTSNNPFAAPHASIGASSNPANRGGLVLTLGIISLAVMPFSICCLVGIFFGAISMGLGITATIMGSQDLRAIRELRINPAGRGQTIAGMTMGIIAVALGALILVVQIVTMFH